jgi:prophage antirepressor-like protein
MTSLIPFAFEKLQVRVITGDDGEPLFVGKDVCDALGYADHTNAIKLHCKGVVKRHPLQTAGGVQNLRVLAEADMMRLVVSSTLPSAQQFEALVFETILPTIRKTGAYVPAGLTLETLPASLASQVGGIIKAVVRKQIEDMLQAELPRLLHGELSRQSVGVRYGRTAGQIMRDHRIPPQKNLANRVSRHLCRQKCQSGTVEVGGKPVKLFDPDAASAQMKLWMYDDCLKYIQERRGQMPLALVGRVG